MGSQACFVLWQLLLAATTFEALVRILPGRNQKLSMLDDPRSENGNKLCLFWTLCTSTCGAKECDEGGFSHVARFAAHRAVYASKSDRIFCVVPSTDGDIIRET